MALIIEYIKNLSGKVTKPTDTICEYKSGTIDNEKIVVFSTKGATDRKNPKSSSQTLHFNKDSASKFINILKEEFDL